MTPQGFQLTEDDKQIILLTHQLRLASLDHLQRLTHRPRNPLSTRLKKLAQATYLYRRRQTHFDKYLYSINRQAIPVLVSEGIDDKQILDWEWRRLRETKPMHRQHALMLADIHASFLLNSQHSPTKLTTWREGKPLYDQAEVWDEKTRDLKKYPVRPDAYFTLTDNKNKHHHFFLEADRSTENHTRFKNKLLAYNSYFQNKQHTKKYKIQSARVIIVTKTRARATNLAQLAQETIPKKDSRFYYFTTHDHFLTDEPEHIFQPIFLSAKDFQKDKRYTLQSKKSAILGRREAQLTPLLEQKHESAPTR